MRVMKSFHLSIKSTVVYKKAHNEDMNSVVNLKIAIDEAFHSDFLDSNDFQNSLHDIDLNKSLFFLDEQIILIALNCENKEKKLKDLTKVN